MIEGVVEQIEEHLLEPLGVAGDKGYLRVGRGVVYLHAGLPHKLAVGEKCVFKLRRDVDKLDTEVEAAVLYTRKFKKLLYHSGEALGLLGDDVYAPERVALDRGVIGDGLCPAGDGGERGAKLVRDLRDEVRSRLLGHGDLDGHVVYLVGETAYLIVGSLFYLRAVAPGGYALRRGGKLVYRVGHIAREP